MNDLSNLITSITPVMTRDLFSSRSGLRLQQLKGQAQRRNLIMFQVGGFSLVNTAALSVDGLDYDGFVYVPVPAMSPEKFGEVSGLNKDFVVRELGYSIPVTYIGRLKFVDLTKLYRMCLEDAKRHQLERRSSSVV